jgi:hypothetical protein
MQSNNGDLLNINLQIQVLIETLKAHDQGLIGTIAGTDLGKILGWYGNRV